jgi:outer membrane protein OmpA-like peptidoglycan-associated protein
MARNASVGGQVMARWFGAVAILAALLVAPTPPAAQDDPFAGGWTLSPKASFLKFQSTKNTSVIETSSFAVFEGGIEPGGAATVRVRLESVDTGIDLRNVRMRFLFFETYKFPEAVVRTQIAAGDLAHLREMRRLPLTLAFEIDLHGVVKRLEADLVVTLISEELVSIATATPLVIRASDFALEEGILKLQDAAKVTITPAASVSFDFIFQRALPAAPGPVVSAVTVPKIEPTPVAPVRSTALEPEGALDAEACEGRFEILSRTGAIHFRSGSAELDAESAPLLAEASDIIRRCPAYSLEIAGHTDSVGSDALNQRLSEARAAAVAAWLGENGIAADRLRSRGYGETRPVTQNDTPRNRALNRRIEFVVAGRS